MEVGDAFAMCARDAESFDGLIVDCFDENSTVVACLRERETWEALVKKLKPGGRVVANVSTGRGRGARVEDAVACAQALADATSGEVTLWRAGACGIWNELVLSGPRVDWAEAEARQKAGLDEHEVVLDGRVAQLERQLSRPSLAGESARGAC